jgi:hypothetical protein
MALNATMRGLLEKMIDIQVKDAKGMAASARMPEFKKKMSLTSEGDFLVGMAFGSIFHSFSTAYRSAYGRMPSEEEVQEISDIIIKRMAEVRNAIFNAG